MPETPKCLLLRAVLLGVSPIVARVFTVPDDLALEELHDVLQLMLSWDGHPFYGFRVHGQEITQRRQLRTRRLHEFRFRRREKFLYTYSWVDLWEWELRILDIEPGAGEGPRPHCLSGRGAAPPENLGGPRAYMHFLDQEKYYLPMLVPELAEKAFERFASVLPDQGQRDLLREALGKGLERSAQRLVEHAGFEPDRFSPQEANARLSRFRTRGRAHP